MKSKEKSKPPSAVTISIDDPYFSTIYSKLLIDNISPVLSYPFSINTFLLFLEIHLFFSKLEYLIF